MEPPHPHWAAHTHSDEHLNRIFIYNTPAPDLPNPNCADHTYSHLDAQHLTLNRISTYRPEPTDPPHRYWESHSQSDEHLHLSYPTVRQQRSSFPPPSPDSGYFSPSESRARTGKLRVINTTPTPPLLCVEVESPAWRAEDGTLSLGSEGDEEREEASAVFHPRSEEEEKKKKKEEVGVKKGNFFSRGLRRASDCVGRTVRVAGRNIGATGAGAGWGAGIGGVHGGVVEKGERGSGRVGLNEGRDGRVGLSEERRRGKVWKRVRRTLLCRKGPVHLTPVKVRFPLD